MLRGQLAPFRRLLRHGGLFTAVILLLFATACTLNPSPNTTAISGPPSVRLAAPQPNATYLEGVAVNVQAYISNAGADIDRVEVSVDNAVAQTMPQPNPTGGPVFTVTHSWAASGTGTHTIAVTAFRADGSASQPATVTINVLSSTGGADSTEESAAELIPTLTLPPPNTPQSSSDSGNDTQADSGDNGDGSAEATEEPTRRRGGGRNQQQEQSDTGGGDTTSGGPTVTFTQGANVRRGPGTNFVPPIGSYAEGQSAELLGVNPAGDWYKVRYYNAEGWVFAPLVTVQGSVDDLPVDPGPPTPIPATDTPIPPTAVPATAAPQSAANLVAGNIRLDPEQPRCNRTFHVSVDIANLGSERTAETGTFTVQDVHDGQVQTQTEGPIPRIDAGETKASDEVSLTVGTFFDEEHTIVVILNPNGAVPESTNSDNRNEVHYTLVKGNC